MMRNLTLFLMTFLWSALMSGQAFGRGQDREVKDSSVTENFAIYYRFDDIRFDQTYLSNSETAAHIKNYLINSPRIDSITIYAWASPEGAYVHNVWLSQERAKTAKRFLLAHSPDSLKLNSEKIHISPRAENWPGLIRLVEENYTRHDREKVLRILRTEGIGDETRKWRLKQLDGGYTWNYLWRHYMPQLRAATWICVWAEVVDPLLQVNQVEDRLLAVDDGIKAPVPPPPEPEYRTILAAKTNLLYDAVTAVNFAVEVPFEVADEKYSVLYEHHTPWWLTKNNKYCLQFLTYGGEVRWWFAPRTISESHNRKQRDALVGHFLGVYGWGGIGDIQAGRDFGCYQFDFWSAGLTYGYSMPISRYLNLEFSISAGYANIPYQHYIPTDDWQILIRDKNKAGTLHYFGPTKAEVSLVIPIRTKTGGRR